MSLFCPVCKSLLKFNKGLWTCIQCSKKDKENETSKKKKKKAVDTNKNLLELTLEVDFSEYGAKYDMIREYDVIYTENPLELLKSGRDIAHYIKCSSKDDFIYVEIKYFLDIAEMLGMRYVGRALVGEIVEDKKMKPYMFYPDGIKTVLNKMGRYVQTFSIGKELKRKFEYGG